MITANDINNCVADADVRDAVRCALPDAAEIRGSETEFLAELRLRTNPEILALLLPEPDREGFRKFCKHARPQGVTTTQQDQDTFDICVTELCRLLETNIRAPLRVFDLEPWYRLALQGKYPTGVPITPDLANQQDLRLEPFRKNFLTEAERLEFDAREAPVLRKFMDTAGPVLSRYHTRLAAAQDSASHSARYHVENEMADLDAALAPILHEYLTSCWSIVCDIVAPRIQGAA